MMTGLKLLADGQGDASSGSICTKRCLKQNQARRVGNGYIRTYTVFIRLESIDEGENIWYNILSMMYFYGERDWI